MEPLFLIMGETASGKDTLVRRACEEFRLREIVSYATRPRREGEGDTHIFIKPSQVKKHPDKAAYTKIGEYEYFTTVEQILDESCHFYIIDYDGVQDFKTREIWNKRQMITIYVTSPIDMRHARLRLRGDDPEAYLKRMNAESTQFSILRNTLDCDHVVLNTDIELSYHIFSSIIQWYIHKDK